MLKQELNNFVIREIKSKIKTIRARLPLLCMSRFSGRTMFAQINIKNQKIKLFEISCKRVEIKQKLKSNKTHLVLVQVAYPKTDTSSSVLLLSS